MKIDKWRIRRKTDPVCLFKIVNIFVTDKSLQIFCIGELGGEMELENLD